MPTCDVRAGSAARIRTRRTSDRRRGLPVEVGGEQRLVVGGAPDAGGAELGARVLDGVVGESPCASRREHWGRCGASPFSPIRKSCWCCRIGDKGAVRPAVLTAMVTV